MPLIRFRAMRSMIEGRLPAGETDEVRTYEGSQNGPDQVTHTPVYVASQPDWYRQGGWCGMVAKSNLVPSEAN